ncbi:hypothetical protein [Flavobacterium sp.]|uniref:hypothetical protein n=1 Tax=Flavobacterium sp. TaxID=239 RepID=UPI00375193A2
MKIKKILLLIFLVAIFSSCSVFKDSSKYEFSDGNYKSKIFNQTEQNVYIRNYEDVIEVYPISKDQNNIFIVDTIANKKQIFSKANTSNLQKTMLFSQNSFDIDFLTIPFKYRSSQKDLPKQFTTNLNGEIYLGYRTDFYNLRYKGNPLKKFERKITHYGFSFGLFTGFGATAMNPSVTQEQIAKEYDGTVWSKGIAGIIGIDNFTIGLAYGFDDLMDSNKKHWIYQQKPWFGLAFGLNLN